MVQKVKDIMIGIIKIEHDRNIEEAAKIMTQNNRGSIVVTRDDIPVGVFTERDILRLISKGKEITKKPLTNYYTNKLIIGHENTTLEEASSIMEKNNVRRLLITHDGKIKGIVSLNMISKGMRYSVAERLKEKGIHREEVGSGYFW